MNQKQLSLGTFLKQRDRQAKFLVSIVSFNIPELAGMHDNWLLSNLAIIMHLQKVHFKTSLLKFIIRYSNIIIQIWEDIIVSINKNIKCHILLGLQHLMHRLILKSPIFSIWPWIFFVALYINELRATTVWRFSKSTT